MGEHTLSGQGRRKKTNEDYKAIYTDLYQLMPANYVFTYLHCLGSDCVGVMPEECDVAKRQDVACVEDVKLLPEHRKRSPVRNLSWVVRTVFFSLFLSFPNS